MFVSESTLTFMGTKLQVMSAEGRLWEGQIDPSLTVEGMKRIVFAHFYPQETSLGPDNFRVIFPKESRSLGDTHAIQEEHLSENDMLFFIRRRSANAPESDKDVDLKTPTAAEIYAATKDFPVPPPPTPKSRDQHASGSRPGRNNHFAEDSSGVEASVDFQSELRKIIISLVTVMATLLHANPDANLICQQVHSRLKRRLLASNKPVEGTSFKYPPPPEVICTPIGIIAGLAEVRKREFRPNPKAVEALKEMGFQEEQIIEALRATKNTKDAAAELLASGKKLPDDEPETGLDPQSHLFQSLTSTPTVRLGLSNPKCLLAFLNILESPSSANMWLNDLETAPVLSTIFKIYHAEKHAAPES